MNEGARSASGFGGPGSPRQDVFPLGKTWLASQPLDTVGASSQTDINDRTRSTEIKRHLKDAAKADSKKTHCLLCKRHFKRAEMDTNASQQFGSSSPAELPNQVNKKAIELDALAAMGARLNALPPRQKLTLQTALKRLAPAVKKMRANGYSTDEVTAELTKELAPLGMAVSARSLARFLPRKKAAA